MAMTMDGRDAAVWGSPVKRAWWAADADAADAGEAWRTAPPQRAAKMTRTEAPRTETPRTETPVLPSRKHARDDDEEEQEEEDGGRGDALRVDAGPSWWRAPTTFVATEDGYTVALDENRNQNGRPEAHAGVAAGQPRKQRRTEAPLATASPDMAAMHTMSLVPHVPLLPPTIAAASVVPVDNDDDDDDCVDPAARHWRVPATVVLHPAYSGVPHLIGFGHTLPETRDESGLQVILYQPPVDWSAATRPSTTSDNDDVDDAASTNASPGSCGDTMDTMEL